MPKSHWESSATQAKRILSGGLAASTNTRLRELLDWGGSGAFMEQDEILAGTSVGIHPIGPVLGIATGGAPIIGPTGAAYARETKASAGPKAHNWREDQRLVRSWETVRKRALGRLTLQAEMLDASAVIGVRGHREGGSLRFTGTAVRIDGWGGRCSKPPLTSADGVQLTAMLTAGVEPAGVAGGFASVQTIPSRTTGRILRGGPRWSSFELEDLTGAVYEVRRLALSRLVADARGFDAHGVLGVDLAVEHAGSGRSRSSPWTVTVHVIASAVRRVRAKELHVSVVLGTGR